MRTKIKQPNYKQINEIGRSIDCTITSADFNTNYPNPNRIDYTISDINRYLKHVRKKNSETLVE